jgi:hypothetical protein
MSDHDKFIPITKIDEVKREVYGFAAVEEADASDEIMDFESSRPHFVEWSQTAQKRSGGKSMGNLRAMHQTNAAGKLIQFAVDDQSKGFFVGAKIVDEDAWKKVQAGVYTGFSIGGSYLKRWPDQRKPGLTRYTAKPSELSLVDAPCIPSATFQMVKADGYEIREFHPGNTGDNLVYEMDIEKVVPTPPTVEPVTEELVDGNQGVQVSIHQMPAPNHSLVISTMESIPSTQELTQANVKTVELMETVNALIKGIPAMIEKAVYDAIENELTKEFGEAPIEHRMIKVERKHD